MEYNVVWSEEAIADLHDICTYIVQEDPPSARRVGERILDHVRILAAFPFIRPAYPAANGGLVSATPTNCSFCSKRLGGLFMVGP
jgi:plasmid stabilization system protein ParE